MSSPPQALGFWRWAPLAALTVMNLLNYIDRYVVTALLPELQAELHMTDGQGGLLGTAFMVVYFLVSPIFGWLGDRYARPRLLAIGVTLWSLATAVAGCTRNYGQLFLARSAVGIGEAAYGSIAPSLITDWFERAAHGRTLALFYLATPAGSALGYLLGGTLGAHLGWRPTFWLVGLPGLLMALVALLLPEPRLKNAELQVAAPAGPLWQSLKETYTLLWRNRLYVTTVAGYTVYTFAMGGFAFWAPSYMMRVRGFAQDVGMLYFGGITVVTGIVGTLLGGWIGDQLLRRTPKGYTWLGVIAMLLGSGFCWMALRTTNNQMFMGALALAQLCLFLNTGPVNALIVGCVPWGIRGSAMATSIFCIHLFGDATSPYLIGALSDVTNLQTAIEAIPLIFLLAGVVWSTELIRRTVRT